MSTKSFPYNVTVNGSGDENARVIMVGEAIGYEEARNRRVFTGKTGDELRMYLKRANVSRTVKMFMDNVFNRMLDGADRKRMKADFGFVEESAIRVQNVINRSCADVICTLGSTALKAITGIPDIDLETHNAIPMHFDGFVLLPMYNPAAGIRDNNLMTPLMESFNVLNDVLRGKAHIREDFRKRKPYKGGNYDVIGKGETRLQLESPLFVDTEWSREGIWCVTYSTHAGWARMIKADNAKSLETLAEFVRKSGVITVLQNALYDIPVLKSTGIVPQETYDTMVMAYLLQDVPQGLKPLGYRIADVIMRSYNEVISSASNIKYLKYIDTVAKGDWEDPDPVIDWKKGKPHVRQPQNVSRRAKAILKAFEKDRSLDMFKRWSKVQPEEGRSEVEDKQGKIYGADLSDVPFDEALQYACMDADVTGMVYDPLFDRIIKEGLLDVFLVDMKVLETVADMHDAGILIDKKYFRDLGEELVSMKDEINKNIDKFATLAYGKPTHVNVGSTQQKAYLLYKLGVYQSPNESTDERHLRQVMGKHPVVGMMKEYGQVDKLKSSYTDVLIKKADEDGRIRTTYRITRVDTGRLSSSNPNLMAQPSRTELGRRIKGGFLASPGCVLLRSDYSQIEMRIAADNSGDEKMAHIFHNDLDIHRMTAADIFRIDPEDVEELAHRYPAKRAGFGILTSITGFGLIKEFEKEGISGWTEELCDELIEGWYDTYSGVYDWKIKAEEYAMEHGIVRDMFGRIRRLPGVYSSLDWVVKAAIRAVVNGKVQMGAQGVIKRAMMHMKDVYRAYQEAGYTFNLLLQIHDELVFEVSKEILEEAAWIVKTIMEKAVKLSIPLQVSLKVGDTWLNTKKYKV